MLRRLFADPVTIKELSGVSRRWQTYAGRTVYIAIVAFVLFRRVEALTAYARLPS